MKFETNFWDSFVFAGRSLYFRSTSRTHCVWPERDPGARFEVLVVSADGHRTLNTQRIDD
jgi:hypothetical protein